MAAARRFQQKAQLSQHKELWPGFRGRLKGGVESRASVGVWDRKDRESLGMLSG